MGVKDNHRQRTVGFALWAIGLTVATISTVSAGVHLGEYISATYGTWAFIAVGIVIGAILAIAGFALDPDFEFP